MKRHIALLGSTGSIGRQALDVIETCGMQVTALAGLRSVELLEQQARRFHPQMVAVIDETAAGILRIKLGDTDIRVVSGPQALIEAATLPETDTVLTAVVGLAGLEPTLAAVRAGKRLALANKEALVCGGELLMTEVARYNAVLVPVDSEHSALHQCLQGNRDKGEVSRLILTASGGPFYGFTKEQLKGVTPLQALQHPNWSMGTKITIDSATLMNKGLEFIEAIRLYRMPPEKISVVIHRESIVHSMVEYCDHAILAQMGATDMRLPIQYALTWPVRMEGPSAPLDLLTCPPLTFAAPDLEVFPCLGLAMEAARSGEAACAVLSGANETAVGLFLQEKIRFQEIPELVARALDMVERPLNPTLQDILAVDRAARDAVLRTQQLI